MFELCKNADEVRDVRALNMVCGICVLFVTLAYAHLLHHHIGGAGTDSFHSVGFVIGMAGAIGAGVMAFIGACLLLKRAA